ncbi:MAG: UDP-N-acetylmuramoyl-tripeptide--D-alanyl-D-alanine ligase [Bdellovibrionales bacterium]|nr:UDP-N-acetylmuramoyl-tripeptide--D-alanyl-D-alanine ligase [Bdellovibrionales bacterium]
MNLNTEELCSVIEGCFLQKKYHTPFRGVSIDSREADLNQKIFFAIKGAQFDGHDFLDQALKKGANILIVHKTVSFNTNSVTIIQVDDTLKALHRLASWWRQKLKFSVIGITGSTGKTTTKNFCLTLLNPKGLTGADLPGGFSWETIIASPKSFNNTYGVPLTLLSATENTKMVIQEIGMNQKGEIKTLCQLAQPDIVTVTQVGSSHIGMLGDKAGIAREKEEIYINSPKAIGVFNLDDSYTKAMYERWNRHDKTRKALCFSSQNPKADVFFQVKQINKYSLSMTGHLQGVSGSVIVPVVGAAHLNNLMAASALALAAGGIEHQIWQNLSLCRLPEGRNQWIPLSSGAQALFDAYNASYESVMALLDYFLSPAIKAEKILILGDFMELGAYLRKLQMDVAHKLVQSPVTLIWLIGDQASSFEKILKEQDYKAEVYCSKNFDLAIVKKILPLLSPSTVVAFKASRKMQMEKVLTHFQPQKEECATQSSSS